MRNSGISRGFWGIMGILFCGLIQAQELPFYTGSEWSNPTLHDGGLSPVVGAHAVQLIRANREHPDASNGGGWTYNHQPMLAYWKGRFYYQYLSDSISEHVPPSKTWLVTSADGYQWSSPRELFPVYPVPDGFTKPTQPGYVAQNLTAIMHQRVGFYVSKDGRLLTMANYGVALHPKDDPNDGNGIGRVVREIFEDGSLGPIYFIYYNHGFSEKNTRFPFFKKSRDKGFVRACREIVDNPLYRMQWVEEADRGDALLPLPKVYKAFCSYTLQNGRKVAFWKHALTSVSADGGNTWKEPVERAKGFVNSNAKIWGQRLTDGSYATVYNPSEYRWPLAISLSSDGLEYTSLNLVQGDFGPLRYQGNYKNYGPQYTRGIQEGNGVPADSDLWVAYSVNKEDMWISRIPVPVRTVATAQVSDDFSDCNTLSDLTDWNLYSPCWAPVSLQNRDGHRWLVLQDKDPYDYAKVERVIPETKELEFSFHVYAAQVGHGLLQVDFMDAAGTVGSRIEWTPDSLIRVKGGARFGNLQKFNKNQIYTVRVRLSVANRNIQVEVDGKKTTRMLYAPIRSVSRIAFRTGAPFDYPTPDTPADQLFSLPHAGEEVSLAEYGITDVESRSLDAECGSLLKFQDFQHYVARFNTMEPEATLNEQAIPNDRAASWMQANIPLFECPDAQLEELYYFRWWTLRKHIRQTPVGYGMTEFLVERSYADSWNLISCALGHHIYESRWLRDSCYLNQIIRTWYRGKEGAPLEKMMKFSSWNVDAVYNRFLVDGYAGELLDLKDDLEQEYLRWEQTHRLPNGLYWQYDVRDGMEESVSGSRRGRYARPTINSYMYGNARALAQIGRVTGDERLWARYTLKADTLRCLIESKLWNPAHAFFETLQGDTLAQAREAIGYLPWYFQLPGDSTFEEAWLQLFDEKGFSAPYGLTTAERRHPSFRTHGSGQCEWDGAIWPFATAQTLTALAHYLNDVSSPVVPDSLFFLQFKRYAESQSHRGRPYIGEYLDETTGHWLKDDQLRSYYYNHSTFNDLLITGVAGLRPRPDATLEVHPLLPSDTWNWFCLDGVAYHGHLLTILWDRDGSRYRQGKGFRLLVDGKCVACAPTLTRLVVPDVCK